MSRRRLNLANDRFGKLVVVTEAKRGRSGQTRWLCKCDCGNEVVVTTGNLRSGNTKSCGCGKRDSSTWNRKEMPDWLKV
jgi:hypothetical protein